jgi:hypothetical protein
VKRLAVIAMIALGMIMPGKVDTAIWTYTDCGGFRSYPERLEFHRIARKHFHPRQIAIVYDWPRNPYFIDEKGRRCKFR